MGRFCVTFGTRGVPEVGVDSDAVHTAGMADRRGCRKALMPQGALDGSLRRDGHCLAVGKRGAC